MNLYVCAKFGPDRTTGDDVYTVGRIHTHTDTHTHTHTLLYRYRYLFVGMQDFLPDFVHASRWYSVYGIYPRYRSLVTAMHKAKDWIQCAKVGSAVSLPLHIIQFRD